MPIGLSELLRCHNILPCLLDAASLNVLVPAIRYASNCLVWFCRGPPASNSASAFVCLQLWYVSPEKDPLPE